MALPCCATVHTMAATPARYPPSPPTCLPADGRFGCGPVEGAARGGRGAGRRRARPTWAPATARRRVQVRGRPAARRPGRAVRPARRLRGRCSATAAPPSFWDAATFGLIERRSQHLVFGEFSSKFAARRGRRALTSTTPEVIESAPGTHPDAVGRRRRRRSTPSPTTRPRPAWPWTIRRPEAPTTGLVLVDATSAAGGLRVDPAEVDVYYFAPQKCFASDGGLWLALCSPAAVERIERIGAAGPLGPGVARPRRSPSTTRRMDQTYNTPALATLFLARRPGRVDASATAASSGRPSRCDRSAEILYGWAEASLVRHAVRGQARRAQPRGRHHRPRRRRSTPPTVSQGAARQRHRRHRVVPQARPQPAAHRHVPGHRARRRRRADPAPSTSWRTAWACTSAQCGVSWPAWSRSPACSSPHPEHSRLRCHQSAHHCRPLPAGARRRALRRRRRRPRPGSSSTPTPARSSTRATATADAAGERHQDPHRPDRRAADSSPGPTSR